MPRRKFVCDLKTVCLLSIAKNMDDLWCADYAKNFLDKGNFLYLFGPFDCLSSDDTQHLVNILCEQKWMKRYYLHLLINSQIESLDLSVCRTVANKDSIVNLIRLRCQKIKKLNIACCNQVSARIISDVVNTVSNLQFLNLQRTKCNDQVLSLIGHKLPAIRELNVSSCPVTDMGIMSLCVNFDPQFIKCEKLYKLDISNTAVTCKGAQVAVENLRNLVYLDFPDICDVVYRKYSMGQKDQMEDAETLKLRYLSIAQMKPYAAPVFDTVKVCVMLCPHITEVHFMRAATNESVLLLGELKHLRVLHIGNSDEELITFEEGILPTLQAQGAELLDISLHEVNKIDIGAVAACCPNLQKFSCIVAGYALAEFPMHTHPEMISAMKHKPFTKLEQVKVLIHTAESVFPPQYVKMLTINALKLKSLHLSFVQSFNDSVLDFILESNKLKCLENCYLESCHQLSGVGIHKLIGVCEVMQSLVLKYCNEVTRQDFANYCKLCRDNNYEINIEWM